MAEKENEIDMLKERRKLTAVGCVRLLLSGEGNYRAKETYCCRLCKIATVGRRKLSGAGNYRAKETYCCRLCKIVTVSHC